MFLILDILADVILFVDVIANFHTGTWQKGIGRQLQTDKGILATNYLFGWFPLDAITAVRASRWRPVDYRLVVCTWT